MLYAETGEVNRRAPYLCRFSDCLITEMKKEFILPAKQILLKSSRAEEHM